VAEKPRDTVVKVDTYRNVQLDSKSKFCSYIFLCVWSRVYILVMSPLYRGNIVLQCRLLINFVMATAILATLKIPID